MIRDRITGIGGPLSSGGDGASGPAGDEDASGTASTDDVPATVSVEDVSVTFGELPVLEGVSLRVEPGEFVGLIGPNGAGKTTCLRAISGAIAPDAGTVRIGGVDVHDCSSRESSRLVAVVPQETNLSFSFDVETIVEMGRHPYRSRFSPPGERDRELVERALERTRTARFADRAIDEVSGGERQRVLLARAIAQDAPVLLLDEPTANLDVNHQIETLELVRDLVDDGTTAIAAIHDLTLAARYCDRLLLLGDGGVRRAGDPETVLSDPSLADAFDATVAVAENPVTGTSAVTALPAVDRDLPDRVHVLGSGSTGAGVLARLAAAGVETTVGPVPEGDATVELAVGNAAERIVVPPFRSLADGDVRKAASLIDDADATVLAAPHPETVEPFLERLVHAGSTVIVDGECERREEIEPAARDRDERFRDRQRDERFRERDERFLERHDRLRERAIEADLASLLEAVARAAASPGPGDTPGSTDRTDLHLEASAEDD